MKRVGLTILFASALILVLLGYWTSRRVTTRNAHTSLKAPQATGTKPPEPAPRSGILPPVDSSPARTTQEGATAIIKEVFNSPISFFGKVQDQDAAPIDGANVEFGAVDKFWESGSNYHATSDANGLFSINGIKGAGLTVAVSKKGYDGIKGLSYQSFGYGMPPDSNRKAPPRQNAPAVFVLRKKAGAEPLFVVRRDVKVPKDGSPVEVNLRTGKTVPPGRGDLKIEVWTADESKDAKGHYGWHARIAIPAGGLMRRTNTDLDFTAPETGYEPSIEIVMPPGSTEWRRDHDSQYWLKLHDQTYARMRLRVTTSGDHFVTMNGYLNPSGSRNLEYDEEKEIK